MTSTNDIDLQHWVFWVFMFAGAAMVAYGAGGC